MRLGSHLLHDVVVDRPIGVVCLALLFALPSCAQTSVIGRGDAGPRADASGRDGSASDASTDPCAACRPGQLCRYEQCLPDLGRCGGMGEDAGTPDAGGGLLDDPCPSDSYCDAEGYCTPYGVPAVRTRDTTCLSRSLPAPLVPATQCLWDLHDIISTPLVLDMGFRPRGPDDDLSPSVIVVVKDVPGSLYSEAGHVYIFDGSSCEVQFAITGPGTEVVATATPAVGDLDLDGRPEIVVPSATSGLIAFHYDRTSNQYVELWTAPSVGFFGGTISLVDLIGDPHPEVVYAGYAYGHDGTFLANAPVGVDGAPPGGGYGRPVVLADVDLDGETEMIGNDVVYGFAMIDPPPLPPRMGEPPPPAWEWVQESYDTSASDNGFGAVADFGDFPGMSGDAPGRPELVHWGYPTLTIRTVGGDDVFTASSTAPRNGGAPAVADLDGDGLPEVVVAGHAIVAFDPDCRAMPRPGGACETGTTNGILWTQTGLNDASGAINGVTVFDFDGDGRVEIVQADECFVRIFDGTTGTPRWSAPRVSCTAIEMPVVADVDRDFSAEIIVGADNLCPTACTLAAGAPDPILPGFACVNDLACPEGSSCVAGLCRCTSDDQCGEGNVCTLPLPAYRDGMGNVCRSTFDEGVGLRIYGDARNRWVPSRPVWNQYDYSVTNVDDVGTVPARGATANNWEVPGLNDYRRQTQRDDGDGYAPNLTIGPSPGGCLVSAGGPVTLTARFCNRGTGVAGAASSIQFDAISADGTRTALCTATADVPIIEGTCVDVTCTSSGTLADGSTIEAVADANQQVQECREGDNTRLIYTPEDCIF